MPRKKLSFEQPRPKNETMAKRLANELEKSHESGQPLIYEQELGPDRLRISVVWDEWDHIPLDERTTIILRAYEIANPSDHGKIALANGLTVPEATAAGMLPYQVATAIRKNDPVSIEECKDAMLEEGASKLFGTKILQLRFATLDEAEASRQRLIEKLPKSKEVWVINQEISVQDLSMFTDSAATEVG